MSIEQLKEAVTTTAATLAELKKEIETIPSAFQHAAKAARGTEMQRLRQRETELKDLIFVAEQNLYRAQADLNGYEEAEVEAALKPAYAAVRAAEEVAKVANADLAQARRTYSRLNDRLGSFRTKRAVAGRLLEDNLMQVVPSERVRGY